MGGLGFLVALCLLLLGVYNYRSSVVINRLRSDFEVERRQRIVFELYQLTRLYYADHSQRWPKSAHDLITTMEYPGVNRPNPNDWEITVTADTQHDWAIKIRHRSGSVERTFAAA